MVTWMMVPWMMGTEKMGIKMMKIGMFVSDQYRRKLYLRFRNENQWLTMIANPADGFLMPGQFYLTLEFFMKRHNYSFDKQYPLAVKLIPLCEKRRETKNISERIKIEKRIKQILDICL